MSGADDAATDEEIAANVAESKSPAITSPSDQLHPILLYPSTELGNDVKCHEIVETACKTEVHNNSVFEHLMQHFFESQDLDSTPPTPTTVFLNTTENVQTDPSVLENLAQETADVQLAAEAMGRLSEEDTLADWVKEARLNGQPTRKRLKKGPRSGTRPVTRSRGPDVERNTV